MNDAGAAQKRPALRGAHLWLGASLLPGHLVPLCSLVAPCHDHKFGPPDCTGYFVTDP